MKTLFIVEPDNVLLQTYVRALQSSSLMIITFRTANLAVKALNKVVPDAVVLELALPGHNGFEFLYELRSYSDTRNTKVIINSMLRQTTVDWSYVTLEDFGIYSYLYKPETSIVELRKAMGEIL